MKTFKTFEIPLDFLQRELWVKFRGKFSVPNSQPAKSHDTLIVSPPVGRSLRTKGKLRQFSGSKLNGPSNESVFAHYCFHKKKIKQFVCIIDGVYQVCGSFWNR